MTASILLLEHPNEDEFVCLSRMCTPTEPVLPMRSSQHQHTNMHTCTHAHMQAPATRPTQHIHMHIYRRLLRGQHTHTHTQTCIHAYMRTCTHAHTYRRLLRGLPEQDRSAGVYAAMMDAFACIGRTAEARGLLDLAARYLSVQTLVRACACVRA